MVSLIQSLSIFRDTAFERSIIIPSGSDSSDGYMNLNVVVPFKWGKEIDFQTFRTSVDGTVNMELGYLEVPKKTPLNFSHGDNKKVFDSVEVNVQYKLLAGHYLEGSVCTKCARYFPYVEYSSKFVCWECKHPMG